MMHCCSHFFPRVRGCNVWPNGTLCWLLARKSRLLKQPVKHDSARSLMCVFTTICPIWIRVLEPIRATLTSLEHLPCSQFNYLELFRYSPEAKSFCFQMTQLFYLFSFICSLNNEICQPRQGLVSACNIGEGRESL